ncbi:MAG: SUMF1/EgtB/PvdO family nonheme iron enzyme [Sedimentisphaerales bacterium]|nr:SUMF1/EgtB/PvdO family nonheme iron enzyme [Sedimentisphaerales bacterium]
MPNFGRYKTVRELYRIGFIILYSGRAEDSPEEKFAVKVFQPSALLLEKERAKAESDLFLSSVSTQQKVSASGAQHWAPIFDKGLSPDGAFYVTNKYDHSLQQLIDGRVKLTAQALHAIIESAAKGLIELKQACSRPHGNLKAANVLITGAADFSQTKVVLTDPLPDEQIDTEVHWDTDLRAIAEFIYQFVMHRPSPVSIGWQVPETQEWARLGKQADDWRNLCNRLLNAYTKPGAMTIENFLEELSKLKVTKPIPTHRYIIAAGLTVAMSVIILWFFLHKPPPPPQLEDWRKLCSEYLGWVDDLHKALGLPKGNTRAKQWREDPDLSKILEKIRDASYPDRVAVEKSKTVNDLKEPKAEEELLGVDARKTEKAVLAIKDIKSFFDPNTDKAWLPLRRINEGAKDFYERGWQRPAAYLQNFVDAVQPGPGNKTIPESVDKLLELHRRGIMEKIRGYMDDIAKYQKTITGLGDPILAEFDDGFVNKEAALGLGDAGEEPLSKLSENLREINNWAGKLAGSIGGDWQKAIDRETFVKDHGNDNVGTLTMETFTKRLEIIQGYRYLRVDPRDEIDGLVRQIEDYIKEGQISNPKEAAACTTKLDELRPNINEVRSIRGITKNEQDIKQGINRYKPQLDELRERALRARELPRDYVKRMEQEALSPAKSDKVIEKWTMVKKALLQNYPLSKIEQNLELYAELRQKMYEANNNLVALDEEIQTQLPLQVGAEMGEEDWQRRFGQIYEQERENRINRIVEKIPLTDAVPDINEAAFKNLRLKQYSEFGQWRDNLAGIVRAFNAIAGGLELYYSLDDNLPQIQKSISSLWQTWKDKDILKDRRISDGLNELISRIEKLVEVRRSGDRMALAATALDPHSRPEAVYAAWERLGAFSDPHWPNQAEDWENDKKIQETLKVQFDAIKGRNQSRGDELLKMLSNAGIEREKVFRKANTERYRAVITTHSSQDQVLLKFDKFQPYGPDSGLSEIKEFEALATKLAEFVTSDDWQSKKFRTDLLPYRPQAVLSTKTFEEWLEEIKEYHIIETDPRSDKRYTWNATMSYIQKELAGAPDADDSDKLRAAFEAVKPNVENMLDLPAIEKHKAEIFKCEDYWKQLMDIQNKLKPVYCKYLNLTDGQVILSPEVSLRAFEPVTKNENDSFVPAHVPKWNDIRTDFFYTTNASDAKNMGWPKYIRSSKDSSVILAFVPAGRDNPEPFYMAAHEITNAQYCLFLKDIGAKDTGELEGGTLFVDQGRKQLVSWASFDYPRNAIKYDKPNGDFVVSRQSENAPVVWVTFSGATSYADWLGGQLPTSSQYSYACRAGADTKYPWGNDLTQIQLYAHVRAASWQRAANEYNTTINALVDMAPCPIGAVKKESLEKDNTLDTTKIVCKEDDYNYAWPLATTTKPNVWGLYDMIGNVWEWCSSDEKNTQTVICGGSCLAPLEYVTPDSKYDFKGQDSDVGFRVIVPAKLSP